MPAVRAFTFVLALLSVASPAFAQQKPGELLIGKWEFSQKQGGKDVSFAITFDKTNDREGNVKLQAGTLEIKGSYKLLSDNEMEISMTIGNEPQRQKLKFTVTKETLETTDEQGKTEKFTRAK